MKYSLFFTFCGFFISFLNLNAQTPNIKKVVFEPNYPHYNKIRIEGDNISNVNQYSFFGDWVSGFEQCRPCGTNTSFNLSVNRGASNPILIQSGSIVVNGIQYSQTVGSVEMSFNVPPFQLYRFVGRRDEIHLTRKGTAAIRVTVRRDFPHPPEPFLDQTVQMYCTASARFSKYRRANGVGFLHDVNALKWECTAIE